MTAQGRRQGARRADTGAHTGAHTGACVKGRQRRRAPSDVSTGGKAKENAYRADLAAMRAN